MFPKIVSRRPTTYRYLVVVADTLDVAMSQEDEPTLDDIQPISPWTDDEGDGR